MRIDDYAWMKDDNWQQVLRDPQALKADVREHLVAENAYTRAILASTEALQADLFAEMKGRIKEDDSSVPAPDGPWDYYVRYDMGAQHPIHARRPKGRADGEQVLLDEEALSKGKAFFQVGAASHSPDHALYAWAADEQGSEYYTIRVKDLASGDELGTPVESAYGDFAFSPDSQWIFWIWRDENARPSKVFRRPARGGEDVLVYEETDDGMFLGVGVASDDSHVLIHVGNQETTEILLIPATDPTAAPLVAEPREVGIKYSLDHWTDRWVIRTNADGAVDFKLAVSDAAVPAKSTWRDWIAHQPGRYITGFAAFAGHLVRAERVNALDRLVVTARDGSEHEVGFDEEAYALNLEGGYEYETTTARFVYQSPTTPRQTYDYDLATPRADPAQDPGDPLRPRPGPLCGPPALRQGRRRRRGAYHGPDAEGHAARRLGAAAGLRLRLLRHGDGAQLLHPQPQPGGSGLDLGHGAHPRRLRQGLGLVPRRPQGQQTQHLHRLHRLRRAPGGRGLRDEGQDRRLRRLGRGMLMGAVANLRPDLWGAIIAAVPFVDVLNTMSDTTLPLTPPEWPEWGNPLEDAAAYDLIASYSPYDQVAAKPYPPILATGGLSDPRVTYWEPAKWTAKLREASTGDAPILLKINMEAGHGGASGRFDFLKEIALDYAFAIWAIDRAWEQA